MVLPFEKVEREVFVRSEAETDPTYGQDPNERSVEGLLEYGIITLNKPQGPTSHQIVDFVKKILHLKKAGHSGTLDPNVTGVLVVALEKVTRSIDILLKSGKEYVCLMKVHADLDEKTIREFSETFIGKIEQLPPVKSAVKRQLRTREIYYIEILEIDGRNVLFKVGCQAGTYIRKLCTDWGQAMGTKAHMHELVRTKVAHFTQENWVSLHDLKDAYVEWKEEGDEKLLRKYIQPVEKIVETLPHIWMFDSAVDAVCHGAFLSVPGISKLTSDVNVNDTVALMTLKNELVGIGQAKMNAQNMLRQEKGIAVGNTRIFMPRGTYPKYKREDA
jgi:H/ACA ribonucleoprotein complex subunit 4